MAAILDACCTALLAALPGKTFIPSTPIYDASLASYWSVQEETVLPSCIVRPTSATDVSAAIEVLTSADNCQFAIRSGGHNPNAGTANIPNGVTLDLSQLNAIMLSEDKSSVSIGPGAVWGQVYEFLNPMNLTVAGGRVATVGAGGVSTGGGISFLSPRVGFSCDTITNYQVVLANGSIVNSASNDDLHFSLKGGSNNFGVVTNINMTTIPQGLVWGGEVIYSIDTIDAQLQAFAEFSNPETYDDYSSLILTFAYEGVTDISVIVNNIEYTKDVADPPAFQPFLDIPFIASTMRFDTLADIGLEIAATAGSNERSLFMTITHGNSLSMLNATYAAWSASITNLRSTIAGRTNIVWSLSLEPIPPSIYKRSSANANPNALGLSDRTGTLVAVLLSASWIDPTQDSVMQGTAQTLFENIKAAALQLGEYDEWLYLNYANTASWQGSPIESYGEASVQRLEKTSREADPNGVFQNQVPGGFKLP